MGSARAGTNGQLGESVEFDGLNLLLGLIPQCQKGCRHDENLIEVCGPCKTCCRAGAKTQMAGAEGQREGRWGMNSSLRKLLPGLASYRPLLLCMFVHLPLARNFSSARLHFPFCSCQACAAESFTLQAIATWFQTLLCPKTRTGEKNKGLSMVRL